MLKGISPLLSPRLLMILAEMGHGDEIAIVDGNFPASRLARRLVRADGVTATDMLRAVLTVFPLDDSTTSAANIMQPGEGEQSNEVVREFATIIRLHDAATGCGAAPRDAFYELAGGAYAIVSTGERRLYGNILLRKGVVRVDD